MAMEISGFGIVQTIGATYIKGAKYHLKLELSNRG